MSKAKVEEEVKVAMKARDQLRLNTLRGFLSELKREEIDTRVELTEERFIAILQKEIKKRRDSIEFAKTAGRTDIIEQNETELKILQGYLGEQLCDDKLKELIVTLHSQGNDSIGKLMGALNKDYKGRFDGKLASELIKATLN